jgi:exportin-7
MNLLQSELSDELGEDPLDNVEVIQDQLEFFPYLCRFQVHVFLFYSRVSCYCMYKIIFFE